ncbi:Uncharacterised protein [Mycobacteroides abscessus subsp. abscessus]|nr:Uncharacterised protein [Mycobacteroides abscessus subsp. abscessus]
MSRCLVRQIENQARLLTQSQIRDDADATDDICAEIDRLNDLLEREVS